MCEYFGYEVTKLERIQIMDIKLGTLPQGDWRDLTEHELERLFDMIEDSENNEKPKANTPKKTTANTSQRNSSQNKNSNQRSQKQNHKRSGNSNGPSRNNTNKRRK